MNELGWSNYANDHEDGNGQFEQNFHYADALTTADRLVFFRYMVHILAHDAGMAATFMPNPLPTSPGAASTPTKAFGPGTERNCSWIGRTPAASGLSEMAYDYIGGLIAHAPAMVAVTCPIVNSYKRMGVGAPTSGATWAPAYATYGSNNRTQMLRIPDAGRVENRGSMGPPTRTSLSRCSWRRVWTASKEDRTRESPTRTISTPWTPN